MYCIGLYDPFPVGMKMSFVCEYYANPMSCNEFMQGMSFVERSICISEHNLHPSIKYGKLGVSRFLVVSAVDYALMVQLSIYLSLP
jgi:hypothetical protein